MVQVKVQYLLGAERIGTSIGTTPYEFPQLIRYPFYLITSNTDLIKLLILVQIKLSEHDDKKR